METIVVEDSPLAAYLEGAGGDGNESEREKWSQEHPTPESGSTRSLPSSPSFAPLGRPIFRPLRTRRTLPLGLRLDIPRYPAVTAIQDTCFKALNATLGRAENERFLEQFRYLIVASQLLNTHSFGHASFVQPDLAEAKPLTPAGLDAFNVSGATVTAAAAFILVWMLQWVCRGASSRFAAGRSLLVLSITTVLFLIATAYVRRQWLHHGRQQMLQETSDFLLRSRDLDSVASGAFTLVQEVELVSRGYRLSHPLPPITRLEDRTQTRRCARLRKHLRLGFSELISRFHEACAVLKPLAEQLDLEKYYDIYDVSTLNIAEEASIHADSISDDVDSLRALKLLASRFFMIRKVFLCCLLALDARGGQGDYVRWSAAVLELRAAYGSTTSVEQCLRQILDEEQSFPVPPTPKLPSPSSPGRDRRRTQFRKLDSLSSGIRGLQAKLHVLREDTASDRNEAADTMVDFGSDLLIHFESIGDDLKALMQEWEDAKAALASNLDRGEKRCSSISGLLSPTTSLSGRTAVDDGNTPDSNKEAALDHGQYCGEFSCSDAEEVFEAVALPKPKSLLTREERMEKMKEERARRASMREKTDASTHMLRELQSVIGLKSRRKTNLTD